MWVKIEPPTPPPPPPPQEGAAQHEACMQTNQPEVQLKSVLLLSAADAAGDSCVFKADPELDRPAAPSKVQGSPQRSEEEEGEREHKTSLSRPGQTSHSHISPISFQFSLIMRFIAHHRPERSLIYQCSLHNSIAVVNHASSGRFPNNTEDTGLPRGYLLTQTRSN